jgi:hypothetical protein
MFDWVNGLRPGLVVLLGFIMILIAVWAAFAVAPHSKKKTRRPFNAKDAGVEGYAGWVHEIREGDDTTPLYVNQVDPT